MSEITVQFTEHNIERLRESKRRAEEPDYQFGVALGVAWAQHRAEYGELQNLESGCADETRRDADEFVRNVLGDAYFDATREENFEAIFGNEWEQFDNNGAKLRGFVDAAYAAWQEVKDKI